MKSFLVLFLTVLMIFNCAAAFAEFPANANKINIYAKASGDVKLQDMLQETLNKFQVFTYIDDESGLSLPCNLFLPEGYENSKTYPMVVFIADASVVGKDASAPLRQGYGGVIWAAASEQVKHECIILIPEYPSVIIDDHGSFTVTDYVPVTERLIRYVADKYCVNKNRIYATGQSMGCMMLMLLAAKHPDLFAAELFVSGQWDVNELDGLETQKFFYVTAEGDDKASTGQRELIEKFQSDKVPYTLSLGLDARMSQEEFAAALSPALNEDLAANFVQFKLGSVLPEGVQTGTSEHMFSFDFAYKIDALRDWLFRQSR